MQIKAFSLNGNPAPSFDEFLAKSIPTEAVFFVMDYPRSGRFLLHNLPSIRNLYKSVIPINREHLVVDSFDNGSYPGRIFFLEMPKCREQSFLRFFHRRLIHSSICLLYSNFAHNKEMKRELGDLLGISFPPTETLFKLEYKFGGIGTHQMRYFYLE